MKRNVPGWPEPKIKGANLVIIGSIYAGNYFGCFFVRERVKLAGNIMVGLSILRLCDFSYSFAKRPLFSGTVTLFQTSPQKKSFFVQLLKENRLVSNLKFAYSARENKK